MLRALLASVLGCSLVAGCGGGEVRRSGVLITLDTTNARDLGCYGSTAGVSPHLDALARESTLFEAAHTVAPLTLPAHASMLTGLWPARHTVHDNALTPLPRDAETLAERAHDAGYQTAAFLSAVVLAAPWGLDQGFETYDVPAGNAGHATAHMLERSSGETTRVALDWLRGRDRERPFFLWVHYFDPHAPYEPAPAYRRPGGTPYRAEIEQMDAALGTLLDGLRADGALDESALVVVADHGEMLGAHGEETHSVLCYEEVLHVPFLVRRPDGSGAGTRSSAPVSVVDVYPTFLEALGLGASGDVDGASLWSGAPADDRGVFFESYTGFLNYGWSPLVGWLERSDKYLHGTTPELYDLATDPRETENLASERPEAVERAREAIALIAAARRLALAGDEGPDDGARSDIQSLGYAGVAGATAVIPPPLTDTGLPDARARMDELAAFYRATLLAERPGRRPDAIEAMKEIADANPRNVYAQSVLGAFLVEERRYQEALAVLLRMPEHGQDRALVQDHLGHSYEGLGNLDEALRRFRRALELNPRAEHMLRDVIRLLQRTGRTDELAPYRERLDAVLAR